MRLFIVLMLMAGIAQGSSVYKCTDKHGNPVYSDKPCKGTNGVEAKLSITPPPLSGTAFSASDDRKIAGLREKWGRDKLATQIRSAEQDIARYQRAMNAEIAQLERKQRKAKNNLAGAQYHNSLSTQMQAVTQKYTALIDTKHEIIKSNQRQLNHKE